MSDEAEIWARLAALTPARIGLGRAGSGQRTDSVLRFGLAHAQARDAVHEAMDADAIRTGIEMSVETRAEGGRTIRDFYHLRGAATAMDAAAIACRAR